MFLHRTPFLLPLVLLASGIILAPYFDIPVPIFLSITAAALLSGIFVPRMSLTGPLLCLAVFLIGHYLATPFPLPIEAKKVYRVEALCKEVLSGNNAVLSIGHQRVHLKVRDTLLQLRRGDSVTANGRLFPITDIGNFGAFSYNRYLLQKNIRYRLVPTSSPTRTVHTEDVASFFQHLRQKLTGKIDRFLPDGRERAVVKALCLGDKNDLDSETRNLFSSTGTVHLLAVSGLHTGAVFLLLSSLFNLLHLKHPKARLAIIPLLWCYACLTGLSPSVIRAANILSFIIIGNAFMKNYTPLNSIAASAFATLAVQPEAIYSLSMQMSYAAYTGIVTLYPTAEQHLRNFPAWLRHVCRLFCVSLAAQIATAPLAIYHFHTVNVAGPLINLIAVPITTLLFYSALVTTLLPLVISLHVGFIAHFLCRTLFLFLDAVDISHFSLSDLYPSTGHLLFTYGGVLLLILLLSTRHTRLPLRPLIAYGGCFLIFLAVFNYRTYNRREMVTYHLYGKSCILLNHKGKYAFLYHTTDSTHLRHIHPYIRQNRLTPMHSHDKRRGGNPLLTAPSYVSQRHGVSLITAKSPTPKHPSNIWIVCDNVFPQSSKEPYHTNPQKIIADASNRPACLRKWEAFCNLHRIEFLKTEDHGAVVIPLLK